MGTTDARGFDFAGRAREEKATKLVAHFELCGWTTADVEKLDAEQWKLVAALAGVKWNPAYIHEATIARVIEKLDARAGALSR